MPVHWPCLLLMGCLHWLGKSWLDGQVTLLEMQTLNGLFFIHGGFCSSCPAGCIQSFFWKCVNSWVFVVLWAAGSSVGANVSVTLVRCEVDWKCTAVTCPSEVLTRWLSSQAKLHNYPVKQVILFLITVSLHRRKRNSLPRWCDWQNGSADGHERSRQHYCPSCHNAENPSFVCTSSLWNLPLSRVHQ